MTTIEELKLELEKVTSKWQDIISDQIELSDNAILEYQNDTIDLSTLAIKLQDIASMDKETWEEKNRLECEIFELQ